MSDQKKIFHKLDDITNDNIPEVLKGQPGDSESPLGLFIRHAQRERMTNLMDVASEDFIGDLQYEIAQATLRAMVLAQEYLDAEIVRLLDVAEAAVDSEEQ